MYKALFIKRVGIFALFLDRAWYTHKIMALKISVRKQYLAERKNAGQRVTIGFTGIADLRHFIGLEYIKGMMKAAADYDIHFINMGGAIRYSLFDDINFLSYYEKNFTFMRAPLLDGLVTWAASLSEFMEPKAISGLFSALQPLPMVDIGHMDIPGASMIKIDSNSAMQQLLDHLISLHHYRRFAFVGTDVSAPQTRRLLFFQHELEKRGLPQIPGSVVMMHHKMEAKYIDEAFDRLCDSFDLKGKKEIDAVIAASDIIAAEGIEQLSRRGISVPSDLAVVGFNNWYESVTARSPLTTVDLVYFKRGYAAVELLIDKILMPGQALSTVYFPTELIVRKSCGCLEPVVKAAAPGGEELQAPVSSDESEDSVRQRLSGEARNIFPYEDEGSVSALLDAFFADVYDPVKESRALQWFQNSMQNQRKNREFDPDFFQTAVSRMRNSFLTILKNEKAELLFRVENIFHQMRALVSVFQKYESIVDRENPYRLNNISGQAINFLSATSMEQVFEVLRYQLSELDIPGVVLALSDTMSSGFLPVKIVYSFPEPAGALQDFLGTTVSEPHLFPKAFFAREKRRSFMLEVLHHGGLYFGYAFFEMKTPNLAVYDVLRMLLSNALYTVYKGEGRERSCSSRLGQRELAGILDEKQPDREGLSFRPRLTVEKITGYLSDHLAEMTDIGKMAAALMVSRSFLTKKTKELTGLTVQQLHEKMKIEQAKNMLLLGGVKLSDIARELGFASQNYFSAVFKKSTGLSPLQWVKRTC